ncbi:acyl-CoA dehydrogenase [Streptomyces abikoensis]|uniref:acyl-CoA dehydrogenase n=1 Tax=Streptomyces abikoensis TaxID=97398 RepID=UPI0033E77463
MNDRMTGLDRAGALEALLGDPHDDANPYGYRAVLEADERNEILAEGERMLDGFVLNAEFVPRALGGRLTQADDMVRVLRTLFRRDITLGLGYGVTNFIASAGVWAAGSAEQRRWTADLLLSGGKIAAGYNELAHGNDFTRVELRAVPGDGTVLLNGGKQVVNNLARADAAMFLARTADEAGARSHSHVLVDMRDLSDEQRRYLPRFGTAGVRGCRIGGVEFTDCAVPDGGGVGVVGGVGQAMETVLKAFQVTRGVLPGMAVGGGDAQLRTVLGFALGRRLYGRTVADLPHARSVLTAAYADLLTADCLAMAAARALHVLPAQTSVYTAAAKYLVPKMLQESSHRLATVLGARSYLRDGPHAIFQKVFRDLPAATFGHANSTVCLATIIPQLPQLARKSWGGGAEEAPAELFRFASELPELDFGALEMNARGADGLSAVLRSAARAAAGGPLAALCEAFVAELADLTVRCADLRPKDRTVTAGPEAFALADRFTVVLAAASCLGHWLHDPAPESDGRPPAWLVVGLSRLAARLGRTPAAGTGGAEERAWTELLDRYEDRRAFDLSALRLAG